ncbi:MAG TPA: hypothetical protein VM264_08265 [Acidimicrobiales bacterium]|nr:hypothetical protein [Acidimicrobiales bacterium]
MASARGEDKGITTHLGELRQLVVDYFKQETVDPIKRLGRFVAYGVAGSALAGIGVLLLTLSGLRALQTETGDTFDGNWSWAPYGIVLIASGLVAVLAARSIGAPRRRARKHDRRA